MSKTKSTSSIKDVQINLSNEWMCQRCSEVLDDSFDTCWKCGTSKDNDQNINSDFLEQKNKIQDEIIRDQEEMFSLKNNSLIVVSLLKYSAYTIWIIGFIAGLFYGTLVNTLTKTPFSALINGFNNHQSDSVTFSVIFLILGIWCTFFLNGLLVYAAGEGLELLNSIKNSIRGSGRMLSG